MSPSDKAAALDQGGNALGRNGKPAAGEVADSAPVARTSREARQVEVVHQIVGIGAVLRFQRQVSERRIALSRTHGALAPAGIPKATTADGCGLYESLLDDYGVSQSSSRRPGMF